MDSEPKARETIHNAKPSAKIQRRQKDTQKMLLEIAALRRGREKKVFEEDTDVERGEREKREEGKEKRTNRRTAQVWRVFF